MPFRKAIRMPKVFNTNYLTSFSTSGIVTSVDSSLLNTGNFVTGGQDGSLKFWRMEPEIIMPKIDNGKKRVKSEVIHISPKESNIFHENEILQVIWFEEHSVVTGSLDHFMKIIDVQKMKEVSRIDCKDNVPTSLAMKGNILISGHEDSYMKYV